MAVTNKWLIIVGKKKSKIICCKKNNDKSYNKTDEIMMIKITIKNGDSKKRYK